ncbi:hypothetical protein Tco_0386218 [Tanacetum coccineum]
MLKILKGQGLLQQDLSWELKPLPKIDPKDKGKKMTEDEESDSESDGINETEKKFKQLAHDEEIARKMQEEWEVEEEKNRLAEEKAINAALVQELDDVKATIEADRLLLFKASEEEIEKQVHYTEERGKWKLTCRFKGRKYQNTSTKQHYSKKSIPNRNFDEIQDLYERIKRSNDKFLAGSAKDEEKYTKKKDEEVPAKQVDEDVDELKLSLVIAPDEDKEVDYEILDRKYPIVKWKYEFITTKPQHDESKEVEEVNLNVVIRSNGQRRHFSTLMRDTLGRVDDYVQSRWCRRVLEGLAGLEDKIKLESEEDSTMALELIRFVKRQIVELEHDNSDGDEE